MSNYFYDETKNESTFNPGDSVRVAPNVNIFDCCGGKTGVVYGRANPIWGIGWILNTDHFCPVVRKDSELLLIRKRNAEC